MKAKKGERKAKLLARHRKATREATDKAAQKEAQNEATKATNAAKAATEQKKQAAVIRTQEFEAELDEKLKKLKATNKEILDMQNNHARHGNIPCLCLKCELLCHLVGTEELEAVTDNDDTKPLAADFIKPAANKYSPRQSNKPKPYEALMALPALPAEQVADLASQDRRRVFHVCEVRDGIHSINVKS